MPAIRCAVGNARTNIHYNTLEDIIGHQSRGVRSGLDKRPIITGCDTLPIDPITQCPIFIRKYDKPVKEAYY